MPTAAAATIERATTKTTGKAPKKTTAAATATASPEDLRRHFEKAHGAGQTDAARKIALAFGAAAPDEATLVNDFAWALLTDEQYGNRYDQVALRLSKTSNEASDWRNWYYLDTYARALFQTGSLDEAIKTQKKAIEIGADDSRIGEAKQTLEHYLEAKKKRNIR